MNKENAYYLQRLHKIIEEVTEECEEAIIQHGHTPGTDRGYSKGVLEDAAVAYLFGSHDEMSKSYWPWSPETFKLTPDNRRKELLKAAQFVIAALTHLDEIRTPIYYQDKISGQIVQLGPSPDEDSYSYFYWVVPTLGFQLTESYMLGADCYAPPMIELTSSWVRIYPEIV